MRYGTLYPAPVYVPSSAPTPTSTIHIADEDGTNFGLGSLIGLQSGASADAFTAAPLSIGTLEANVDLLEIFVGGNGRPGRVGLFNGSASTPFAVSAFRSGTAARVSFLVPIAAGTDLRVGIATDSAVQVFNIGATAHRLNPTSTGSGIVAVGASLISNRQGVTIPALTTGWVPVGTLAADAIGINQIHVNNGNDGSRTSGLQITDIGIGPSGSSAPDRILRRVFGNCSGNLLSALETGPQLFTGMNANRIVYAKTALSDGSNPDAVSVQAFVISGPAL